MGVDVLADHQARERRCVEVRDVLDGDEHAAAQHGDAVADLEDLVETVRDVEDAGAAATYLGDDLEEVADLVGRQHGRRLVEHEDAAAAFPALQRGDDRDDHALHGREQRHRPMDVDLEVEPLQQLAGLAGLLAPVDRAEAAAGERVAKREVVHHAELEHEPEVLVHEVEAVMALVGDGGHVERLALEPRLRARVGLVVAGERLDQRRLARAVRADEGEHLVLEDLERHVLQRARADEGLREALDPQEGLLRVGAATLTVRGHGAESPRGSAGIQARTGVVAVIDTEASLNRPFGRSNGQYSHRRVTDFVSFHNGW